MVAVFVGPSGKLSAAPVVRVKARRVSIKSGEIRRDAPIYLDAGTVAANGWAVGGGQSAVHHGNTRALLLG